MDPEPYYSEKLDPDLIRIKDKIKEFSRLNMESWAAVDAQKVGVEAQNRGLEDL